MWCVDTINEVGKFLGSKDFAKYSIALGPTYSRQMPFKGRYVKPLIAFTPVDMTAQEVKLSYLHPSIWKGIAMTNRKKHEVIKNWALSNSHDSISEVIRQPKYKAAPWNNRTYQQVHALWCISKVEVLDVKARAYERIKFV